MASVNKVIIELYGRGKSIPDVAAETGKPLSTVRYHLKKQGVLRSREEGIRLAASQGKLKGRPIYLPVTDAARARMSSAAQNRWDGKSVGTSLKPSGYVEYTTGIHKGRSVHVVAMEARIGRHILPDEVVHHIDGNRSNNENNNLALMTRAAHARLHRREEAFFRKAS